VTKETPVGVEPTNGGFANRRHTPENTVKTDVSETAGSATGSAPNEKRTIPSELKAIIDAWPDLPEALQAGIVAMVRAAGAGVDCARR
jgi:hypothetical protein